MHRLARGLLVFVVALLAVAPSSSASIFNYVFSGTVDTTSNPLFIAIGETYSGAFQYNDAILDSNADPTIGDYIGVGTIDVIFSGGFSITSGFSQVLVNDLPTDTWTNIGFDNGNPLLSMELTLSDPTGTALVSDALGFLIPANFSIQNLAVFDFGTGDSASGPATVALAPVPEPAGALLLGMGCVGLAVHARNRRSS